MTDIVKLTVNGMSFDGWKSVRIESGLERIARSFELSVTEYWPGANNARRIVPGDLCQVFIGDDLVCTGYVDATPIDYDATSITIMIRGRSKTADLVDCSADEKTGQFKGLKIEAIAKKLAAPFGLAVIVESSTGSVITDHQIQQGETAFESLDRLAKLRQVLITDNAAGDLVIASTGSGGNASSALELGVNILTGSAGFDYSEVYSKYVVKGQKSGTDDDYGPGASQSKGESSGGLTRQRVLIVRQSGQADTAACQHRAQYEQQIRAAKAEEVRYKVAGWRQEDGSLWRVNQFVSITDTIMHSKPSLLISEIIFTLDDSGMITEIIAVPPNAFLTEPEVKEKAVTRKKTTSGTDSSWLD
ncbi:MAG: baseplate protein [Negativicutes bacterium]|jgi:prophage tail gpP-like protein